MRSSEYSACSQDQAGVLGEGLEHPGVGRVLVAHVPLVVGPAPGVRRLGTTGAHHASRRASASAGSKPSTTSADPRHTSRPQQRAHPRQRHALPGVRQVVQCVARVDHVGG